MLLTIGAGVTVLKVLPVLLGVEGPMLALTFVAALTHGAAVSLPAVI